MTGMGGPGEDIAEALRFFPQAPPLEVLAGGPVEGGQRGRGGPRKRPACPLLEEVGRVRRVDRFPGSWDATTAAAAIASTAKLLSRQSSSPRPTTLASAARMRGSAPRGRRRRGRRSSQPPRRCRTAPRERAGSIDSERARRSSVWPPPARARWSCCYDAVGSSSSASHGGRRVRSSRASTARAAWGRQRRLDLTTPARET